MPINPYDPPKVGSEPRDKRALLAFLKSVGARRELRLLGYATIGFVAGILACLIFYPLLPLAPAIGTAGLLIGLILALRKR